MLNNGFPSTCSAGVILTLGVLLCGLPVQASGPGADAPAVGNWDSPPVEYRPLGLRSVRLGGFLGRHVDANNRLSLLEGLKSPIPAAFEALAEGRTPPDSCKRLASDSDFFKWLEGACYAVAYEPSLTELAAAVDRYAAILVRLQEPDGFLGTRLSPAKPFDRRVRHDLYCAGHFIEAAIAHHYATGRRELLDAAVRLADFYLQAWKNNHPYFEIVGTQEHPEIELALARLYRATGEPRFLEFGEAVTRMAHIAPRLADTRAGGGNLHAVRLCYLLTGATELYMAAGKQDLYQYVPDLWKEIVTTRMYVTGGVGYNERVPVTPYDLPQTLAGNLHRDIAETCASVSLMMLSWRLHGLTGDPACFDAIETILYNHYLGAISQDHLAIFYYNPLSRTGDLAGKTDHGADPVQRRRLPEIHSTACCLPNSWRFFGQLPEYVFSRHADELLINLYTDAQASFQTTEGTPVKIEMQTAYPHDGHIAIRVTPDQPRTFAISLRIPAWCADASIAVAGTTAPATAGYHKLERHWQPGDRIELTLPMHPVVLTSHPAVAANAGQVAFRRGPLVYCLEREDADGMEVEDVTVVLDGPRERVDSQHGFTVLTVPARPSTHPLTHSPTRPLRDDEMRGQEGATGGRGDGTTDTAALYEPVRAVEETDLHEVSLVPFYFRANRQGDTRWVTWLPYQLR